MDNTDFKVKDRVIKYRLIQLRLGISSIWKLIKDCPFMLSAIERSISIWQDSLSSIFILPGCNLKDCLLKQLEFEIFEYNHRPLYFSSQKMTKANLDGLAEGIASLKMIQFYKTPQR